MRMIRSPAEHFSCRLVAKTTFSPEEYKKEEEIHAAAKEHPLQKVDWLDWYEEGGEGRRRRFRAGCNKAGHSRHRKPIWTRCIIREGGIQMGLEK